MGRRLGKLETLREDSKKLRFSEIINPSWLKGIMVDVHPSVKMGKHTYVWSFAVICEGVEIGDDCVIGSGVYIGRNCKIGNNVRIQDKVHITDHTVIEDKVFFGPCAVTMNDKYPRVNNPGYKRCSPYFEEGCSLGCNSVILPGIRIGKKAMIGAGAIVTKNVEPGMTIVGNPGRELYG